MNKQMNGQRNEGRESKMRDVLPGKMARLHRTVCQNTFKFSYCCGIEIFRHLCMKMARGIRKVLKFLHGFPLDIALDMICTSKVYNARKQILT